MVEKEKIIAYLRKQSIELKQVRENVSVLENEISEIVQELQDESKIGIPAEYDFGLKELKSLKKKIRKKVKKDISVMKSIPEEVESLKGESGAVVSDNM